MDTLTGTSQTCEDALCTISCGTFNPDQLRGAVCVEGRLSSLCSAHIETGVFRSSRVEDEVAVSFFPAV